MTIITQVYDVNSLMSIQC